MIQRESPGRMVGSNILPGDYNNNMAIILVYFRVYLIKLTCLQISSIALSFLSLKITLFSSNKLRPSVSMDTIRGPNSFTRQCHNVSGIPRSLHCASTISSTSVAATTAFPAGKTQWIAQILYRHAPYFLSFHPYR